MMHNVYCMPWMVLGTNPGLITIPTPHPPLERFWETEDELGLFSLEDGSGPGLFLIEGGT